MSASTITQKMAHAAYDRIAARTLSKEFRSFAREFPTLVHSCGLAQAVAFALAKGNHHLDYANDLGAVLHAAGYSRIDKAEALAEQSRCLSVSQYLRLSRDALAATVWLKRYVEAAPEK